MTILYCSSALAKPTSHTWGARQLSCLVRG